MTSSLKTLLHFCLLHHNIFTYYTITFLFTTPLHLHLKHYYIFVYYTITYIFTYYTITSLRITLLHFCLLHHNILTYYTITFLFTTPLHLHLKHYYIFNNAWHNTCIQVSHLVYANDSSVYHYTSVLFCGPYITIPFTYTR